MGRDVAPSGRLSLIRRQYVPPKLLISPEYTASLPRRLIVTAVRSADLIKRMNLLTMLLQFHPTNAPNLIKITIILLGARGGAVGWGTALQTGRSRVRFTMVSLEVFTLRPHYSPGVDWASNRNEYQEYFVRGKGDRCIGLTTLPPSCANCLEIWEP